MISRVAICLAALCMVGLSACGDSGSSPSDVEDTSPGDVTQDAADASDAARSDAEPADADPSEGDTAEGDASGPASNVPDASGASLDGSTGTDGHDVGDDAAQADAASADTLDDDDGSGAATLDAGPEVVTPIDVEGDQCEEAIVIDPGALPFVYQGDTTWAAHDYSLSGGCQTGGDLGAGAPDVAFRFTPSVSGHHVFGLAPTSEVGNSPSVVWVTTDCAQSAFDCEAVSSDLSVGGVGTALLEAGQTYHFVVDGLLPDDVGGFEFVLEEQVCVPQCPGTGELPAECGKDGCGGFCGGGCAALEACSPDGVCGPPAELVGNTCEDPFVIDALPFAATADTWYGTNVSSFGAGACPGEPNPIGGASNDHFYVFEAPVTGKYQLQLIADYDSAFYVVTACGDVSGNCVMAADATLAVEAMELWLDGGETYTVVVDGYGNETNLNGLYTLQISDACVPDCVDRECGGDGCGGSCGQCATGQACDDGGQCVPAPKGDWCGDPFEILVVPFEATGDTSTMVNDYWYGESDCQGVSQGWGAGSPDAVYRFEPETQEVYIVTLEATFDSTLYIVTDCADIGASCYAAADESPSGESIELWFYPGTTYFIVVDGYGNISAPAGEYTLTLTPACVPACKFKECGDDGCGGECGVCDGSQQCTDEGLCEELVGTGCDTPFVIEEVPAVVEGDSSDATHQLAVPYDACPVETDVRGAGSKDEVWAFTATESGVYTGMLQAQFGSSLYALTDCTRFDKTCFYPEDQGPLVWFDVHGECEFDHEDPHEACLGVDTGHTLPQSTAVVPVWIAAGQTVFWVVDGNANNVDYNGTYTLTLDGPCQPQCEGKTCGPDGCGLMCGTCEVTDICDAAQTCVPHEGNACETAFAIEDVPFEVQALTSDSTNTYGVPSYACPDGEKAGAGSKDEVYSFTPDVGGAYDVILSSTFQNSVYVLTDCEPFESTCFFKETLGHDSWTAVKSGCSFPQGTCVGQATDEYLSTLNVELEEGVTYYIVADGVGGLFDVFGTYTLSVDKACEPQCEDIECGDDGCGGDCGACPGGFVCEEGACIDNTVSPGNTCDTAWPVTTIPFIGNGDTSNDSDVYDGCGPAVPGARDEVWVFTPELPGIYLIDVTSEGGFDPAFGVVTGCSGNEFESCVGGTADQTLDVALDAGVEVFIIVDGGGMVPTEGGYVLSIDLAE